MSHPWPVERERIRQGRTTHYPSHYPPIGRRDTIAVFSSPTSGRRAIRKETA